MIARYSLPKMGSIWSDQNKFQKFLEVELAACEAHSRFGDIPIAALAAIKRRARFKVERINEIEKRTRHDLIAFLENVAENVGEHSRYIHLGMTSSDVLDTALALQMRDAADIILDDLKGLSAALAKKAKRYKMTPMMGRTHGVHAEPTTFGLKMALFYAECLRNTRRMEESRRVINTGKLSGAVGTYANISPAVERYVCKRLSLVPSGVSSQIIQRDRHAQYIATLALIGSSLEKLATEIRNLARTEIREVEEKFSKGQKGSSAMPHKRNPVACERICGLARVLRANALAAMENIALWHERDISHSSCERIIIPDSTILLDYMLNLMRDIIDGLVVYPANMRANIERTKGVVFSQQAMLALVESGMAREAAYKIVQEDAMRAYDSGRSLKELLQQDERTSRLSKARLEKCFSLQYHLKHVDEIFRRLGLG